MEFIREFFKIIVYCIYSIKNIFLIINNNTLILLYKFLLISINIKITNNLLINITINF